MSHNQLIQEILYFDSRCVMALFNLTPYKPPSTVIDRSHFRCWRMSAGSINKKCTSNRKVFQLPRISMPAASDLPWALENQVTFAHWIPMSHFLTQCQKNLTELTLPDIHSFTYSLWYYRPKRSMHYELRNLSKLLSHLMRSQFQTHMTNGMPIWVPDIIISFTWHWAQLFFDTVLIYILYYIIIILLIYILYILYIYVLYIIYIIYIYILYILYLYILLYYINNIVIEV